MLINLRNALMAGKRLPYDAEVEYLESTGTQWIDTGILPTATTTIKATCSITKKTNWSNLIGCGRQNGSFFFAIGCTGSTNTARMIYGTDSTAYSFSYSFGAVLDIVYNDNKNCYINGALSHTFTGTFTPASENIMVLGINQSGYNSSGRVYSIQIYSDGVGSTLLFDGIPVRKGTVGYLYDRVSGKLFGNAGTGDFVLGQDVVPVEYIESHGTEWIDTGFKSDNTCKISVDMENRANVRSSWVFGSRNGSSSAIDKSCLFMQVSDGSLGYAMLGSGTVEFDSSLIKNNRHTVEMSLADGVVVDGVAVATFTPSQQTDIFTNTFPMALFNLWNGSSLSNYFQGRLYGFSVKSNGIPRLKYAPVRVGTEGAMMDTLTRRIYRNAGTGAFTYGNDLPCPIPA